jgi:hypothetical protein
MISRGTARPVRRVVHEHLADRRQQERERAEAQRALAILDWIAHGDMTREELHGMLLGAFAGALTASGAGGALAAAGSA